MANQSVQGILSPFLQTQRVQAAAPWLRGRILDVGAGNGALAQLVPAEDYVGFELDDQAREAACEQFPEHRFVSKLEQTTGHFDTVVALAVIEHVKQPSHSVKAWTEKLKVGGHLVLTTPHRSFHLAHDIGSHIGLFSRAAADEHETLFNRDSMLHSLQTLPLELVKYRRFLFGVNQLFVFKSIVV